MADNTEKRLVILGKGSNGGGGGTQVQSDWTETDTSSPAYIKNKPTVRKVVELTEMTQSELADFYTNYSTLMKQNTYLIEGYSFTTTTVEVQGVTAIIIEYQITLMDSTGGAPAGTVVSNLKTAWLMPDGTLEIGPIGPVTMVATSYVSTVGHTGSYNDLTDKPTIPAAQVNSDWNSASGVSQILNKPSMTTETLTFVDENNVETNIVVYIQPTV